MKPFDSNGKFSFGAGLGQGQVRQLAVRGAGATVLSGGMGLAVQIMGTVVLARLLAPSDFGVVTMVTSFSLLLMNFGGNGFTEAIIQREEIDEILVSNLFWINLGIGLLLTAGFAAAGSLLGDFFRNPAVAHVAVGMSATIVITSASVQHLALLKRALQFSATSANEVFSRIASLAVSISLAWMGWGVWALVGGAVAQALAVTVGAWCLCPWIPKLPQRAEGTGAMLRFALNVYGRFAVNYFTRNSDNVLVGWRFGPHALGFYKKAYDLFALSAGQLTAPLTNVAVAALSRFDPRSKEYRQNLLSAVSVIAFVGMGLSAAFTLVGRDLIRVLLGAGWERAGQIFTFFAPGIGVMLIYYMHGWIHLSIGRADRWFRWGMVEVAVTCLLFLVGLRWGPEGVAVAWAVSFWILTGPALWYAGRPIDFGVGPVLCRIWRYLLASLLAGGLTAELARNIPGLAVSPNSIAAAVAGIIKLSGLFGVLYLFAVIAVHRGMAPIVQFIGLLTEMGAMRRVAPPVEVASSPLAEPATASISGTTAARPLVSILIPAFNAEQWIVETLRSAVAQTWERKEIIVVDDGSTDRTLAIARQFECDSVRVVSQKNQGAAAARNKAFSLCRGDFIQWLDADDLLAPDKVARQIEAWQRTGNNRLLFSCSWGRFMYRTSRAEFTPTCLWQDLTPAEWLTRKMESNDYMQTGAWLVSRELTEAAGPWNTSLMGDDDGEYFCRVLRACEGVRFVAAAREYYRTPWFNSLGYVEKSDRKVEAHWISMKLHITHLRSLDDSSRVRAACVRYLQTSIIYFYPERPEIVKQVQALARELGGELEFPRLPWKYSWIQVLFGWRLAKQAQFSSRKFRWALEKLWDKQLFQIEAGGSTVVSEQLSVSGPEAPAQAPRVSA